MPTEKCVIILNDPFRRRKPSFIPLLQPPMAVTLSRNRVSGEDNNCRLADTERTSAGWDLGKCSLFGCVFWAPIISRILCRHMQAPLSRVVGVKTASGHIFCSFCLFLLLRRWADYRQKARNCIKAMKNDVYT